MDYFAHTADTPEGKSDPDESRWQKLTDPLRNVAKPGSVGDSPGPVGDPPNGMASLTGAGPLPPPSSHASSCSLKILSQEVAYAR